MSEPLLALAGAGQWAEFAKALGRPENLGSCVELAATLEAWGDESLLGSRRLEALHRYNAAFQCCIAVVVMSVDAEQRAAVADPCVRLNDKFLAVQRNLRETPDEAGIVAHPEPNARPEESVLAPHGEVQEDLAKDHWEKTRAAEVAIVEERLAHPLAAGDAVPEGLGWDAGMRWVEHLTLSGRTADANRLLSRLRRLDPVRDQQSPGRLELIGDYLAECRPELARWFYLKLVGWLSRLPMDCAAEAAMVNRIVGEAQDKLTAVEARLRS